MKYVIYNGIESVGFVLMVIGQIAFYADKIIKQMCLQMHRARHNNKKYNIIIKK